MTALPYQELQQARIDKELVLNEKDRLEVVNRLVTAMNNGETRIVLFVVVQFLHSGEVVVVPDMRTFGRTFESRQPGPLRPIDVDAFSVAMLDAGEDAYREFSCLIDFLNSTHHGWYVAVRDVDAVLKKPRNFWKRFANMFENYNTKYREFRLIVDLRKTAEIMRAPRINQERSILFGIRRVAPPKSRSQANDTTTREYSSGVFSRGTTEDTVALKLPGAESARSNASSSDSSSSSSSEVISSTAREFRRSAAASSSATSHSLQTGAKKQAHLSRNSSQQKV